MTESAANTEKTNRDCRVRSAATSNRSWTKKNLDVVVGDRQGNAGGQLLEEIHHEIHVPETVLGPWSIGNGKAKGSLRHVLLRWKKVVTRNDGSHLRENGGETGARQRADCLKKGTRRIAGGGRIDSTDEGIHFSHKGVLVSLFLLGLPVARKPNSLCRLPHN